MMLIWFFLLSSSTIAQNNNNNINFAISKITINGNTNVSKEQILNKINFFNNKDIFIDIAQLQNSIKQIPLVKHVTIKRILPNTIIININEHKPIAQLTTNNKCIIINKINCIDSKKINSSIYIPKIYGSKNIKQIYNILELIKPYPQIYKNIYSLNKINNRRWNLIILYNNQKILIKLPEQKLKLTLKYLNQLINKKNILDLNYLLIDMRLKDRVVVSKKSYLNAFNKSK